MIKDGQDQVDFASSFLKGTALLWFLSCLESRRTFANSAKLKESLSATFSPLDREEDDRLNLFGLTQTGPLDDYIQDFSHLSLNVTALDEHSRAKDHLITGTTILQTALEDAENSHLKIPCRWKSTRDNARTHLSHAVFFSHYKRPKTHQ